MPFIPHTEDDIHKMLASLGLANMEDLFAEIPPSLRLAKSPEIPEGSSEMALRRAMDLRAKQDLCVLNFIGAGAYEHHIPAAISEICARGEWMTAYTPYQAEASQGTLQLLYEYQSMMAELMGMEVSNASMYDGASSLAEALLMAVRLSRSNAPKVLLPSTLNPFYREVVKTLISSQNIEIIELPYSADSGALTLSALMPWSGKGITALVLSQPNFFGVLEDVDTITNWAAQENIKVIGVANPTAMAWLKPPGAWGDSGATIACGEGQPLGIPLCSGGPYFGFLTCKKADVRQLPGRLVGRTTDQKGQTGFTLTLQAREQHIRRAKATSNICTNQGLLVTAATLYMSLLGPRGLQVVALQSHENARRLSQKLELIPGVTRLFKNSPFFHEIVLKLPIHARHVIQAMAKHGIQAGFDLSQHYPELGNALLLCATETKTEEDLSLFAGHLKSVLQQEVSVC